MAQNNVLRPRAEIRRFDIFAEWNRLKARQQHKLAEAEAQAYGLAVAKVVAARKFSGHRPEQLREWKGRARRADVTEAWWEHLGSSREFEQTIIARMGKTFYRRVFQPSLRAAWRAGQKYEQIRDQLRQGWNVSLATTEAKTRKR
jgi:hypothetical protein